MKYQPVIPPDLFNMFIEKLGYMPEGKDILVIRDIYTACFLAINNDVTFVSDDQEAISAFINTVIINDDFKGKNNYIHIDTKINNAWLNWIEKNMAFDIVLENPPYGTSLPFVMTNELLKLLVFCCLQWLLLYLNSHLLDLLLKLLYFQLRHNNFRLMLLLLFF